MENFSQEDHSIGGELLDVDGNSIGTIQELYRDLDTEAPEWAVAASAPQSRASTEAPLLIKAPDGVGEIRAGDRQTPPSLIMEGGQPWRDAQASQAVRVEDTKCRLPASYAKERYRPRRALLSSF
jgi:hypothetical protein